MTPREPLTNSVLSELLRFDRSISPDCPVVGIDEVGRGCLAGAVVASAVRLPPIEPDSALALELRRLNDSKKVDPHHRQRLSTIIKRHAVFGIGEASVDEIDEMNILNAALLAMSRAYQKLHLVSPAVLLIDGNQKIPGLEVKQITVIAGDACSASIAAASIVAKVYRDNLMCRLSSRYPEYLWHQNKGYGSKQHRQAILQLGLTPLHRKSFKMKTSPDPLADESTLPG